MADDGDGNAVATTAAAAQTAATIATTTTDADRYAQALRFLVALQAQRQPHDLEAQRAFLRAKGLSDEDIQRAFNEAKRPDSNAAITQSDGLVNTVDAGSANSNIEEDDAAAFDRAAKMFDDPLHVESPSVSNARDQRYDAAWERRSIPPPPPKTYPRSPLALYGQQANQPPPSSSIDNPLTRYHVLLRFFRSLCYVMVLAGGLTGAAVAVYRTYVMPRLIGTLDARSALLVHHRQLFATLAGRVKTLRGNSLAPPSRQLSSVGGTTIAGTDEAAAARRGVLKKVQFADEVQNDAENSVEKNGALGGDEEDTKQAGDIKKGAGDDIVPTEKAADPAKASIGELDRSGADATEQTSSPAVDQPQALEPIDILEPLRNSLARLTQTLKADLSAGAIGSDVRSDVDSTPTGTAPRRRAALAASVGDDDDDDQEAESDEADSWLDEDEEEEESDELEFDPFAAPATATPKTKSKSSNTVNKPRKHTPKSSGTMASSSSSLPLADRPTAAGTSAASLKSSLNTVNAYINTQTYMANANVFGARSLGGTGGIGSYASNNGSGGDGGAPKAGDVGQVRAEIRSLKGLLLSRRNFPIYSRPIAPQQQQRVEPAA